MKKHFFSYLSLLFLHEQIPYLECLSGLALWHPALDPWSPTIYFHLNVKLLLQKQHSRTKLFSFFFFFSEFPFCTLSIEWLLLIPSTFLSLLPFPWSLSWVKVQSSIVQFISTICPLLLHLWVGFSSSVPGIRLDRANTELLWWKHTGKMSLVTQRENLCVPRETAQVQWAEQTWEALQDPLGFLQLPPSFS